MAPIELACKAFADTLPRRRRLETGVRRPCPRPNLQPFLEGSHRTNGVVRAERNRHRRGDGLQKEEDRDTSVAGFVTEKAAGVLHGPDRTRILRHQGIDGQQRNTLNRRLCH
jgi:hypothetical protein